MSFVSDFKTFAMKGNVLDLAIGVIIGAAFGKIVSALVDHIIMPLIGILLGGKNFTTLAVTIGDAHITYGAFIAAVIDFLIIALVLFIVIKVINRLQALGHKQENDSSAAPVVSKEVQLLTEIRDVLKTK